MQTATTSDNGIGGLLCVWMHHRSRRAVESLRDSRQFDVKPRSALWNPAFQLGADPGGKWRSAATQTTDFGWF
jgi:hypothetical protein